jgi:hypothetical protein
MTSGSPLPAQPVAGFIDKLQGPLQLAAKRIEIALQFVFAGQQQGIEAGANQRLQGQAREWLLKSCKLKGLICIS